MKQKPLVSPFKKGGLFYYVIQTSAGWIGILASSEGFVKISLPKKTEDEARRGLGESPERASCNLEQFQNISGRLTAYFKAQKVAFPDNLDFSGATPFQRKVWETTRLIPYGQTRSYAWVAEYIGKPKASRAVGQALGRNPLPIIIPCHRVVASNGKLGGFTGGIEMKKKLLDLEKQGNQQRLQIQ